jgi:thiol-disulfide isomerase/thioredoxin
MRKNRWIAQATAGLLFVASLGLHAQGQPAPEFKGVSTWLNSPPLTMQKLRGKVVLVDFWAYSCINCLRTLPHVTDWYAKYKDKGLVIVGVHSPEFDFEQQTGNVRDAIKRFGITYPVAQDNQLATWDAFANKYWPAEYLIDQRGQVVTHHFGEGNYLEMENAIRTLLKLPPLAGEAADPKAPNFAAIASPEMYFGSDRQQFLGSPESGSIGTRTFTAPAQLALNKFALVGQWEIGRENVTLDAAGGEIRLHYKAGKVHMVASAITATPLEILVDGKPMPSLTVQASMLYTLVDSADYKDHVLTIRVPKAGFHAFTFTFG